MTQDAVLAPVPGHVPPDAVHDLDIYNIEGLEGGYSEDLHAAWKRVQDSYPAVFWTPRHGGHWVATRFAEIQRLQQDTAVFSSPASCGYVDPSKSTPKRGTARAIRSASQPASSPTAPASPAPASPCSAWPV